MPVAALTSLMALGRAAVQRGDKVLVIGASGGCGIFGVTIGNVLGAKVTSICSAKNAELVKTTLGAASVMDYRDDDAMNALLYDEHETCDVVYDTVTSFAP